MRLYLATICTKSHVWALEREREKMKLYLAAGYTFSFAPPLRLPDAVDGILYVLESFAYLKDWEWAIPHIRKLKGFLLDSGAFTYMNGTRGHADFEAYTRSYAALINKYDIKQFFEVDVDCLVGIKEVERLRGILERETGKKCIPVWHKSRGKQYWLDMCAEYDYVAIGGIATKEIKPEEHKHFFWLNREARKRGAKVHGLGLTTKDFNSYGFYSVDSTSWTSGMRFGDSYYFDGTGIKKRKLDTEGKRLMDYRTLNIENAKQWIAFQRYLDEKGE